MNNNNNNISGKQCFSENDHRRIGKELDLFSFSEYVGSGLALWHPNGAIIRNEIEDFWNAIKKGIKKCLFICF